MSVHHQSSPWILASHQGDISFITLNRVDEGNRVTNQMALDLCLALDASNQSRVIVLNANGSEFCLGRDMPPPKPGSGTTAQDVLKNDTEPVLKLFDAFNRCVQPVVCAVQGKAWGIGMVLAAVADVTLASTNSTFRLRELERGIPPCIAMAPLLDRMPVKALAHLVFSTQEMNAATALTTGVVSQLVNQDAAGQLLTQEVAALTQMMLSFPDASIQAVKHYLKTAPRYHETNAAHYGASLLANVLSSR
ncbi:MAG: enoyl-CoA hydratase/isomerase family protein [Betaproteobacteria bacterium]